MNLLETLGPIVWNFFKLSIQFMKCDRNVELRGLKPQPLFREGRSKAMLTLVTKGNGFLLQIPMKENEGYSVVDSAEIR